MARQNDAGKRGSRASALARRTIAQSGAAGHVNAGMMVRKYVDIGPAPRGCRWPLWGDEEPCNFRFCGNPVLRVGCSYCGFHDRLSRPKR